MHVRSREKWRLGLGTRVTPPALACWLLCGLPARLPAQSPPASPPLSPPPSPMPSPMPIPLPGPAAGVSAQVLPGTLSGTVTDLDGDAVAGAKVTLNGTQSATTDDLGVFLFPAAAPGAFKLTISADGFTVATASGTVRPGETTEVPALKLGAANSTDVTVTTSMEEVGKAEVKLEETQRLLGAIPNYFVTYDWKAPPLTGKQKFELSYKVVIDPITVLISEVSAGAQEADNVLSGYGKGGTGFVKRFAANEANVAIGTFTGGYLFPLLLHQDPRYFYMGPQRGSIKKRFFYALSTAVIARGDNGKWQPNYSSVLGDLVSGALANVYYPSTDRHGWGTVIDAGLLGAGLEGVGNVVQEFLYKKLTPHAPNYPAPGQHP